MSEAKHTPGPWTAARSISTTCGFVVSDIRGSVVARVLKIGVPQDGNFELPCEENARLIAAAPDLMESAKAALQVFVNQGWEDDLLAAKALKAAIAKATGGTP